MRIRLLPMLLVIAGCGGSTADFAGNFTLALTDGANGCNFQNWQQGNMVSNVPVVITQSGAQVTANVQGVAGGYLDVVLGSHTFTGTADGSQVSLTLYGTRQMTSGNCAYTINAALDGSLSGDYLTGNINYTSATNGSPECNTIAGCRSTQSFNGTRPPTAGQ